MAEATKISWTHHTWNPWIGCAKVHAGCTHCYAEAFAKRTGKAQWGTAGTRVKTSDKYWRDPIKWNRAAQQAGERHRVFCASLADVFEDWQGPVLHHSGEQLFWSNGERVPMKKGHGKVPVTLGDLRLDLFSVIDRTPHLDWLLLTKRPENVLEMWPKVWEHGCPRTADEKPITAPRPNVWLGTSVSDQATANTYLPRLLKNRALVPVLFASCEPLLGPMRFDQIEREDGFGWVALDNVLTGWHAHKQGGWTDDKKLDWVIVGGESGAKHRDMEHEWARAMRDECRSAGVPFFFKQSSGPKPGQGVELDGEIIHEFPVPRIAA